MYRNIRLNYGFSFFQFIGLTSLWVLYLTQKGFSAVEIGVMEAVFHLTSFCFEIPSGSWADRFGYRRTLIVSRLLNSVSCLLIVMNQAMWLVTIGFVFSALSYNLASGTNEALVFDSLKKVNQEGKYLAIWTTTSMIMEVASSFGMVLAGLFSQFFFDGVYWLQLAMNGCAIGLAWWMIDPKPRLNEPIQLTPFIRQALAEVRLVPQLVRLMGYFAFVDALNATYFFYFQAYFKTWHLQGIGLSSLLVVSSLVQIISVKLAPQLRKRYALSKIFLLDVVLTALAIFGSGVLPVVGVIVCFLLANALSAMMYPIQSDFINQAIGSQQRATINSLNSLLFSMVMIPVFPMVGWLIDHWHYAIAYRLMGGVVILVGGYLAFNLDQKEVI